MQKILIVEDDIDIQDILYVTFKMYFTHLSGIAHYPESAYPRPITVFKSSGPRSSFFRSFAICTSTVRV